MLPASICSRASLEVQKSSAGEAVLESAGVSSFCDRAGRGRISDNDDNNNVHLQLHVCVCVQACVHTYTYRYMHSWLL